MEQLDEYLDEARRFSRAGFVATHPHPWLVVSVREAASDKWRAFRTTSVSAWSLIQARTELPAVAEVYRVLKVQKSANNPWRDRISLGRARNNDIVLRDRSVSKLHAHVTVFDDGKKARLRDAGSRNGTRINGERAKGGQEVTVISGDEVRFGRVEAVYQEAGAFYDFLTNILKHEATPSVAK